MEAGAVGSCAIGRSGVVGEFDSDIEEGIPYITGLHFTIAGLHYRSSIQPQFTAYSTRDGQP